MRHPLLLRSALLILTVAAGPASISLAQQGGMLQRLKRHDKNGDGKIAKEEWGGPDRMFKRFDRDSNGFISQKEMASAKGRRRPSDDGRRSGVKPIGDADVIGNQSLSKRMARYEAFPAAKPAPGELAPMFVLKDLKGNTVSLGELLKTKPVVVETGSCTCPVFRRSHAKVESLRKEFDDKFHFVVLYGREAHAGSGNYADIKPPKTLPQRIVLAEKVAKEVSITVPVAVDDLNNKVSMAYGGLPNSGYLIGQDGRVFFKMPWINEKLLRDPIEALLDRGGDAGTDPPKFATGGTLPSGGRGKRNAWSRRTNQGTPPKRDPSSSPGLPSSEELRDAPVKIPAGSENKIVWGEDLPAAKKLAATAKVPVLVKFHFEGCPLCAAMEHGPLQDASVVSLSRKFVAAEVDITTDAGEKIADAYDVVGTPVFVLLGADGVELARHSGPADVVTLTKLLGSVLDNRVHSNVSLVEEHAGYSQHAWTPTNGEEGWNGFLLKPEGKGPFPAVLANHAGMSSAEALVQNWGKKFVRRGFVVIGCDLGHQGNSRGWKDPGASESNVQRVLSALAILKSQQYVDQDRIAMYGHSMGGFCTLGVLATDASSDIRVAAISGSGIYLPELQDGSRNLRHAAPDRSHANQIQTPLLIIHSDDDKTVPLDLARALERVLDDNKIPCQFVLLKGVGHRGSAAGKTDNMNAILAFFEKHWRTKEPGSNHE